MDARGAIRRGWPTLDSPALAHVGRALAIASFALVALAGLMIAIRHAAGALHGPLSTNVLSAWSILLATAAIAFRGLFAPAATRADDWTAHAAWAAPSGVLLLWAFGLSVDGTAAGLSVLWGMFLVEETASWTWLVRRAPDAQPTRDNPKQVQLFPRMQAQELGVDLADEPASEFANDVLQQTIRRREEDDSETLSGWVSAEVPPGARYATAHVAVCPPFGRVPQCFAEQMDGPPAQVKVAQVLPHGARFEIKLDEPADEGARVVVEFSIQDARG